VRERIRERVGDPELAEELTPRDHPIGTRRPLIDTGYLEAFAKPNVSLVNIRRSPIERVTPDGIQTQEKHIELDAIVFATGFDAITGPLLGLNLVGADGVSLKDKWAEGGAESYIALGIAGFPNLFTITGVSNPITNMIVSIEHHVEWIANCISYMGEHDFDRIEPDPVAQTNWMKHVDEKAEKTLYPRASSWYNGANIPGKVQKLLIYLGSFGVYRMKTNEVAGNAYEGFVMSRTQSASRQLEDDRAVRS
jgi:cyclohexanone monooxygenase